MIINAMNIRIQYFDLETDYGEIIFDEVCSMYCMVRDILPRS